MALIACVYIVAAFLIADSLQASQFQQCGNGPAPEELRIIGCETLPCELKRGTTISAQWDFRVLSNTKTLKPDVKATVFGTTVNYPLPQKDACKSLVNGECPLEKGEKITYSLSMPIRRFYPKVPLTIEFSLIGDNNVKHVCFKIPAKVV